MDIDADLIQGVLEAGSGMKVLIKGMDCDKWVIFIPLFILFMIQAPVHAGPSKSDEFPSLIESLRIQGPLDFCGEPVPIKTQEVRERLEKELLLTLWDRPQVILWLKRSPRFLGHIEKMLKENGMPADLKYIAIIESALRPHVGSPKGAMGYWQFTGETGTKYGLIINDRIDERRNIYSSTKAAIAYFKELHETFESWTLAAAAFNMGENGLMSEIMLQGLTDYYRLYLPLETQRYILRIISAKLVLSNPKKYGFDMEKEDCYPELRAEPVEVNSDKEIPIRVIALAAKTDFKVIKDLNPEIRGYFLAPGNYKISVPEGTSKGFPARFEKYLKDSLSSREQRVYVVKEGDNLFIIAEKLNIPLPALIIRNRLNPAQPIHPGDKLIIPNP